MKTSFIAAFSLGCLLILGCQKKEELPTPKTPEPKEQGAANYFSAAGKAEQAMEKTIDTAAINNALQLFAIQEGRIPETLDELVEKKYLPKLPTPPFGSKLQYDKAAGKVFVVKE